MKTTSKINCYVINLPRDCERRERMKALLGERQIAFHILDAVMGTDLSEAQLAFFEHRDEMKLLPAEFGCLMSHLECWRSFLASDAELALVCEDDIHISPDIENCLAALEFPKGGPAIVRLESFGSFTTFSVQPQQKVGRYGIHRMLTDHGGTAGYLLDRKTAQHLVDAAPKFRNAIDIEMFFPARSSVSGITVYQFIPALVIQDQILTQNQSVGFLKSNMGNERADRTLWNKRNVLHRFKSRSRPYYQAIYSTFLRVFAGKMRLIVPFK